MGPPIHYREKRYKKLAFHVFHKLGVVELYFGVFQIRETAVFRMNISQESEAIIAGGLSMTIIYVCVAIGGVVAFVVFACLVMNW